MWKWNFLLWLICRATPDPKKRMQRLCQLQERLTRELDRHREYWQVGNRRARIPALPGSQQLHVLESVAVVMQGPVVTEHDFTLETLRLYRETFPASPLILSTWAPLDRQLETSFRDLGVEVLANSPPDCAGPSNLNLQVRSVRAGLAAARATSAEFVLKTRTDTRLYAANVGDFLAALVRQFPLTGDAARSSTGQRGRLVALDLATRKYVPGHLSDILMFGLLDDMLDYWQIPEFGPDVVLEHPHRFGDFIRDAIPEVLLCGNYLRREGVDQPTSIETWWRALAERFLVVDRSMVEFFWYKYNYADDHRISQDDLHRNLALVSFRDWLNLATYGKRPQIDLEQLVDGHLNALVPAA
ncbi:MAG: WavE lipopolysaccharide synthesis family protein [Pirellulales bacterium]